jgi:fibronectin type 3 domain-containing protein
VPGTHDRLSLTWSSCDDQDFLRYELYRSLDGDVDSSDALVLASAAAVTFTDTSLAANTVYYYRVRTVDRVGNSAWSNTASGRTGLDEPPDAPTLLPLFTEPDRYEDVQLNWSQPFTSDFREFRVYNWLGDLGRSDSLLIALIVDQDSTSLLLHPSMPVGYDTVDYWYIVHVYDESGGSTASNDVRARLIDLEPETVTGAVIADSAVIVASWIPSDFPDFGVYKLLRDTLSTPGQAQTIFLSADQESNGFDDTNIVQGRTYYYWLEVYDRRDHSSRSFLGSARW